MGDFIVQNISETKSHKKNLVQGQIEHTYLLTKLHLITLEHQKLWQLLQLKFLYMMYINTTIKITHRDVGLLSNLSVSISAANNKAGVLVEMVPLNLF